MFFISLPDRFSLRLLNITKAKHMVFMSNKRMILTSVMDVKIITPSTPVSATDTLAYILLCQMPDNFTHQWRTPQK